MGFNGDLIGFNGDLMGFTIAKLTFKKMVFTRVDENIPILKYIVIGL